MPAPLRPPNTHRLNTKIRWLQMATPDICSVPMPPTIRLSSMFTKLVMPFWIITGRAMVSTSL